ncbi:Beta-lactamase OXA-1 precursor [Delftia tsuruhatensis]|uniref:class D beta-lactamase n=1 Tax=Delftia tsuruhatensis TaxID=180282 RepID=UPI001E75E028|nr:class D beta-lactamase [Delftia tsuruhatensis]CAB5715546.1 Beta-lactamase OXA-1 precursor [Delftia tsuruhatensis]CAC9681496.1 Beta-lactamase OXA-1 precursor [Delftia tsuruhatensis]
MPRFLPLAAAVAVAAFFCIPASARELCTIVADADTGESLVRSGPACGERVTPASTFKIAISLMGYDAGILQDADRPAWPYQPQYPDWGGDAWQREVTPRAWMRDSVFWYSQQVVRQLGQARFGAYVKALQYGNEDISAVEVANPGHNGAWVVSSLRISAIEQVAFMRKIVRRELPVSPQALDMTARITLHPADVDGWTVHGKTGTGSPGSDNRYDASRAYGWYVGWATKGERRLVWATLIQDEQAQKPNAGLRARDALLQRLPALAR